MQHDQTNPTPSLPDLPTDRRALLAGIGGLAAGAFIAGKANAGPLNPPAGPIASTGKTLSEIEPRIAINQTNTPGNANSTFRITQPGSYYLTGNIMGTNGLYGIEIAASGVTLDLNGFELMGTGGFNNGFDGVRVSAGGLRNIALVNGSVRNWTGAGVNLANASNCRVDCVLASGNNYAGIITGRSGTVSNCSSYNNGDQGIVTGGGCAVLNCSACQNISHGILTDFNSTITGCVAYGNSSGGISAASGSTISNCAAVSNSSIGISALEGCTITACTARTNAAFGISVGQGCSVVDCTLRANTQDGIVCVAACVVRGNVCDANGNFGTGAGIRSSGDGNRIESNNCTNADLGISVSGSGNFIVKNTCSGNTTNWSIASANVCLVVQATTAIAITGNSGGLSPGSTDPNANFTY